MADEPDNIVLTILQRMQGDLRDVKRTLEIHSGKFDKLDKRMEEMHESMYSALGFATHANLRHDGVGTRLDKLEARVTKLEDEPV